MKEIRPSSFAAIRSLVPNPGVAGHMAFVHAVLDGEMPGFVLCDRAEAPRSAIAGNLTGFWFALGEAEPAFAAAAVPTLAARRPPAEPTALWCTTPAWERILDSYFASKQYRNEFHPPRPGTTPSPAPAPGIEIRPLDLAAAREIEHGGALDPWVCRAWGGAPEFARRSFGSVAWQHGRVVSFCVACAIQRGGEAEIEVGTDPEVRRQGLAQLVGQAFIRRCEELGLVPAWTCASTNEPSDRLARRLGFEAARVIAGYRID
jgi:GNAT superfamily N-acetyltransferase